MDAGGPAELALALALALVRKRGRALGGRARISMLVCGVDSVGSVGSADSVGSVGRIHESIVDTPNSLNQPLPLRPAFSLAFSFFFFLF